MATQNTGYARMKVITVTRGDYTQSYDITSTWTDPQDGHVYDIITDSVLAELEDNDYNLLLEAFLRYVCSQEPGLEAECPDLTTGSVVWDPLSCPVTVQPEQR